MYINQRNPTMIIRGPPGSSRDMATALRIKRKNSLRCSRRRIGVLDGVRLHEDGWRVCGKMLSHDDNFGN